MKLDRCYAALLLAAACASAAAQAAAPSDLETRAQHELESGRLREGVALLRRAVARETEATPAAERARIRLVLARAQTNLGDYREALAAAGQALQILERLDDPPELGEAHLRIAAAHDELAEYDEAHRHFHRALDLARRHGERAQEAAVLSALGTSYRFLGDGETARGLYERAGRIHAERNDVPALCFNDRNLGVVLEDLERPDEARRHYRRALQRIEDLAWDWARADLLFHLGRLDARSGNAPEASALLERGLALAARSGNLWAEAHAGLELARARAGEGRVTEALELARRGVATLRGMGAGDLEWEARLIHGEILEQAGDVEAAAEQYRLAVAGLEAVRSSLGLPQVRERYVPRGRKAHEALLRLRWERRDRGDAEEGSTGPARWSFESAERIRARSFAEMLAEARIDPGAGRSPLRLQDKALRAKIASLRTRLTHGIPRDALREALESELFDAEREHDGLLRRVRDAEPRYGSFAEAADVGALEALEILDGRAALLAYYLGERLSLGWFLDAQGVSVFELPARADLENLVLLFRSLQSYGGDAAALDRVGRHLWNSLIGPVESRLEPGRELVVVPDGMLFQLPFEALPSPTTGARPVPFVRDHPLWYVPSLAVLRELRRRPARPQQALELLAFADPPPAGGPETRLPAATAEVGAIAWGTPPSRLERRSGAAATESAFRGLAQGGVSVIHLATHGVLDSEHVERSGLAFAGETGTGDGFLNLGEIFDLRLDSDLVVLSACDTAGGELLRGEGILGMSRAFLHAGSRAVVASLWKVDDGSTATLMKAFYRHLRRGVSAAAALRAAKLERVGAGAPPAAWAAFVLIGDGDAAVALSSAPSTALLLLAAGVALLVFAAVLLLAGRSAPGDP